MWVLSKDKDIITNGKVSFCIIQSNLPYGDKFEIIGDNSVIGGYATKDEAIEQFAKIVNEIRTRFGIVELG